MALQVGGRYYAETPEDGPIWGIRTTLTFLFPKKQFDATRKMSTLLLGRSALVPLGASALLPLVAAGATQMPYKELLAIFKKLLLI
jgi:hypothetical protein